MKDEANATSAFKAWEEAYEARKEAKKAVKATPEFKDWEKANKAYKKAKKDYKKAKKDYKKAWKDYIGAKEKKQEAAKVHDEAVEAVYATPEYVEWDAMCTTQEALDELWK